MRAALLCACSLLACAPQEIRLLSSAGGSPDSGAPARPEPDAAPEPSAPAQPACRSPECTSCVAEPSACVVAGAQWLCHPWTGSCSLPCDPQGPSAQCPREQRCHPEHGLCVSCASASDCRPGAPACDPQRNVCVECSADTDCSAPTPACDTGAQRCVQCTQREHCAAGQVCNTMQHTCVQCVVNADCENLPGNDERLLCEPINHVCVECLSNADCLEPDKPFCKQSELECDDDED